MTTTLAASALAVMATHDAFARQADAAGTDPLKPQNSDAPAQVLTCDVVVADAMSPAIGKMMTSGIGPPCGAVGRSGPRYSVRRAVHGADSLIEAHLTALRAPGCTCNLRANGMTRKPGDT